MPTQTYCYRPQTKLRKGNVFTPVCQSFCSWVSLSQHALGSGVSACGPRGVWCLPQPHLLGRSPQQTPGQTPFLLGRHPPGQTPPHPSWPLQRTVRILLQCILVQPNISENCMEMKNNMYGGVLSKFYYLVFFPKQADFHPFR